MKASLLIVALLCAGCTKRDDSDPQNGYSGFVVFTDHKTGCQYIGWGGGFEGKAITARMDADGKQICEARP